MDHVTSSKMAAKIPLNLEALEVLNTKALQHLVFVLVCPTC